MLRHLVVTVLFIGTLSCRSKVLVGDYPPELVGRWKLQIRSSCRDYGVNSDVLLVRADGTFDQHVTMREGKEVNLTGQHWRYTQGNTDGSIALDKRLEFFTPEHFGKKIGEGASIFEDLIVEYKSEPVIVLNPDSDCVYAKD